MLKVFLFGRFALENDNATIPLTSRFAQSLLAYLVITPGISYSRDRLAQLLLPDALEEEARAKIRNALWAIGRSFESRGIEVDEYIVRFDPNLAFHDASNYWSDVQVLEQEQNSDRPTYELIEIVSVYTGELLPGFSDEWVEPQRERLHRTYERWMAKLLERLLNEQEWAKVIIWAERWILQTPAAELAYRALIMAHGHLGDLSAVVTSFQRYAKAEAILNAEPSEITVTLYQDLIQSMAAREIPIDDLAQTEGTRQEQGDVRFVPPTWGLSRTGGRAEEDSSLASPTMPLGAGSAFPKDRRSRKRTIIPVLLFLVLVLLVGGVLFRLLPPARVCGEVTRVLVSPANRFKRTEGLSAFDVENTPDGILSNEIRTLAIDPRGVWFGYFGTDDHFTEGVGHFDAKTFANCGVPFGASTKNINAILIDKKGALWVGSEGGGVARFDNEVWEVFTIKDGLPSDSIYSLTVDAGNHVWAGTWEGVAEFDGKTWTPRYNVANGALTNNHVHAVAFESNGNIWVGTIDKGVRRYIAAEDRWVPYTAGEGTIGGDGLRAILVRKADARFAESVWLATADGGVTKYENSSWTVFRETDGLPSDSVTNLAIDKYNRVWAATTKGVSYFDGTKWLLYNHLNTFAIAFGPVCTGCPYDEDHILTGTWGKGLTESRIPLPGPAIEVVSIKYYKYPEGTEVTGPEIIFVPGDKFRVEVIVTPLSPNELGEGDFLSHYDLDDAMRFGAYELMPVTLPTKPGAAFIFTDRDNPFVAPQLPEGVSEKPYSSTWRVWLDNRYADPPIEFKFTVKRP